MAETKGAVIDSSALLAYLNNEPGALRVAELLVTPAIISSVNWAEVLSWYAQRGDDPLAVSSRLSKQGIIGQVIEVVPASTDDAVEASRIIAHHPKAGLSLGDRFCLSLARRNKKAVITADRLWSKLHLGIEIVSIR